MALSTWWIAALSSDLPKCAAAARLNAGWLMMSYSPTISWGIPSGDLLICCLANWNISMYIK